MEEDTRNLMDEFKGLPNEEVFRRLEGKRSRLEVAIYNVSHDFNVGTIVRNANNFNVSCVHIIGRRKYNRRGAMCTDKYLTIKYWEDMEDFIDDQFYHRDDEIRDLVAIENNVPEEIWRKRREIENKRREYDFDDYFEVGGGAIWYKEFVRDTTLLFGSESDGLPERLLTVASDIREIPGYGSTRSVNVGVASGIAMYEWAKQCLG